MRLSIFLGMESYFRIDATVCVLSTITGLDGGMNFGGCPMLSPAAWWQMDVDRNPEDKQWKQWQSSVFVTARFCCQHPAVTFVSLIIHTFFKRWHYVLNWSISVYLRSFWSWVFRNNLSERQTLSSPFAQAAMTDLLLSHPVLRSRAGATSSTCDDLKHAMLSTVHTVVQTLLY